MARKQEFEVVSFLRLPDGSRVPFDSLTGEERQRACEKMAENVGKAIGDYLTAHPEEIEPLSHCAGVTLQREV